MAKRSLKNVHSIHYNLGLRSVRSGEMKNVQKQPIIIHLMVYMKIGGGVHYREFTESLIFYYFDDISKHSLTYVHFFPLLILS